MKDAIKENEKTQVATSKADKTHAFDEKKPGLTDALNCLLNLAKENNSFKIPPSFSLDVAQPCPHLYVNATI